MPTPIKPKAVQHLVGREALAEMPIRSLQGKPFLVRVKILRAKESFGRTDCLVCPVEGAGQGCAWISVGKLRNCD